VHLWWREQCFEEKTTICNAKCGDLGDNGDRESKYVVESAIFGITDPDLPIHYATLMRLQWWLRVVYSWVPPLLSIFGRRWSGSRHPLLPAAGSQYTAVKLPVTIISPTMQNHSAYYQKDPYRNFLCFKNARFIVGEIVYYMFASCDL